MIAPRFLSFLLLAPLAACGGSVVPRGSYAPPPAGPRHLRWHTRVVPEYSLSRQIY